MFVVHDIYQQFIEGLKHTSWLEFIAVIAGIASVWFSRRENILVYPVGLVNTIIYIYLSFANHLPGEASVQVYYTVMSIYGWILWAKKDTQDRPVLHISFSTLGQWTQHILFFLTIYFAIFFSLSYFKEAFWPNAIPWADAFASASAYTGMWLMTKKKVESWYWWIATNIASIPLYFVKRLEFTSFYYFVLLIIAFWGLSEWKRKAKKA